MQEPFHLSGMRPQHPLQSTVTAWAANGVSEVQWDMKWPPGGEQNLAIQKTNISPVPNSTQIPVRYSKCSSLSIHLIKLTLYSNDPTALSQKDRQFTVHIT